jgi:DNA-directed RNA polymerase III subunit RPC4
MPPKPKGTGTRRARGTGRGGANSARGGASTSAGAAPADGASSEGVSNPLTASDVAAPAESAAASVAESSTRAPVQRLETLKSIEPPSRSTSPAVRRGTSTKGRKPAPPKPVFTARRSKQEREQLQESLNQRDKERQAEKLKEEKIKAREKGFTRRAQNKNRGNFSGPVGGPFSLGSVAKGMRVKSMTHNCRLV